MTDNYSPQQLYLTHPMTNDITLVVDTQQWPSAHPGRRQSTSFLVIRPHEPLLSRSYLQPGQGHFTDVGQGHDGQYSHTQLIKQ